MTFDCQCEKVRILGKRRRNIFFIADTIQLLFFEIYSRRYALCCKDVLSISVILLGLQNTPLSKCLIFILAG